MSITNRLISSPLTIIGAIFVFLGMGPAGDVLAAAARIGARIEPNVRLQISPPTANFKLVENTTIKIPFQVSLLPGVGGSAPTLDIAVCGGDGTAIGGCSLFRGKKATSMLDGVLNVKVPAAGPDTEIKVMACTMSVKRLPSCERPLAEQSFRRPVFARFVIGLDNFTIFHTRAPRRDTLHIGSAAVFADKPLTTAQLSKLKTCTPALAAASVDNPVLCREQARFGMQDYGDGTYPVPKDLVLGEFELIPGTRGRLNFGYVIFNFGAPGGLPDTASRMRGNSQGAIRSQLLDQTITGDLAVAVAPGADFTNDLNGSPWLGCDGPTAAGAVSLANDASATGLDARTRTSGSYTGKSKVFVVPSQTGCGDSSRYQVQWSVRRMTWR